MKRFVSSALLIAGLLFAPAQAQPQTDNERLTLVHAVMCEAIEDGQPVNETIVFSFSREKAVCFTFFNPVPEQTTVVHRWYRRDQLSTRIKLRVDPPQWSTFSRIQFRDGDKGPWRVEIADAEGNLLKTLRFSITE